MSPWRIVGRSEGAGSSAGECDAGTGQVDHVRRRFEGGRGRDELDDSGAVELAERRWTVSLEMNRSSAILRALLDDGLAVAYLSAGKEIVENGEGVGACSWRKGRASG